jgi:alpha-tubulin suppressor-like RCC1 family protein
LDFSIANQAGLIVPDCAITWTTSNSKVATVSTTGVAIGKAVGGPITIGAATVAKPTLRTSVLLSVGTAVATVSVTAAALTLTPGGESPLQATLRDARGTTLSNRIVTWTSANPGVAMVSPQGVVTGVMPGSAIITAASEGQSGTATVTVTSLGFRAVTAGYNHACGIRSDDAVFCWGRNLEGQLGTGDTQNRSVPTRIRGSLRFAQLALGFLHSCGVTTTGEAYCWGTGDQLGVGSAAIRNEPVRVAGTQVWRSLTAGESHTCGLTTSGEGYCWGFGRDDGQLGIGTYENRNVPSLVLGNLTFRSLGAGAYHTCGVTTSDAAYCWGRNDYGALGIGSRAFYGDPASPVPVATTLRFQSIAGGADNSCGVSVDKVGHCWGSDFAERLGNGDAGESLVPMAMSFQGPIASLSLAPIHGCLLDLAGRVFCWGDNGAGQLGDDTRETRSVPVEVLGLSDMVSVSAMGRDTEYFSCATRRDQKAFCWGANGFGQLGDGTNTPRLTPVEVRLP